MFYFPFLLACGFPLYYFPIQILPHSVPISQLFLTQDSSILVARDNDGLILIYDFSLNKYLLSQKLKFDGNIEVDLSENGKWLVVGSTIYKNDRFNGISNFTVFQKIQQNTSITSLCMSGNVLVIGGQNKVMLYYIGEYVPIEQLIINYQLLGITKKYLMIYLNNQLLLYQKTLNGQYQLAEKKSLVVVDFMQEYIIGYQKTAVYLYDSNIQFIQQVSNFTHLQTTNTTLLLIQNDTVYIYIRNGELFHKQFTLSTSQSIVSSALTDELYVLAYEYKLVVWMKSHFQLGEGTAQLVESWLDILWVRVLLYVGPLSLIMCILGCCLWRRYCRASKIEDAPSGESFENKWKKRKKNRVSIEFRLQVETV